MALSMSGVPRLLRRARGYAPEPLQLGGGFADAPPVMAIVSGKIELISWTTMWRSLLADLARGVETSRIAARFHAGLALAISSLAARLVGDRGIDTKQR
jgi:hydrogenase maturation protein HypF